MNNDLLELILPKLSENEIRDMCRAKKEDLGFDVEKALFPLNPFSVDPKISVEEAVELLKVWDSVRESVTGSVWDSVSASVWDLVRDLVSASVWALVRESVMDSMRASVRASVRASIRSSLWDLVWAYISSVFFGITDWKNFDHELGKNPFQSGIDLWEAGYVAIFDGDEWSLLAGKNAEVVWKGKVIVGECKK